MIKISLIKNKEDKIIKKMRDKNEINLRNNTENKEKQNLFIKDFVKNNTNNIELIINGIESKLIEEYDLEKGNNNIKLIIKKQFTDLSSMFYDCKTLYNIEELKNLNTDYCTNFRDMFRNCSSLLNMKKLKK